MRISRTLFTVALIFGAAAASAAKIPPDEAFTAGRLAYEAYDYGQAAQLLQRAAAANPENGDIYLLLAQTYYESEQYDAAIGSAEKAVALNPQSSKYHEWLGRAYGEKANHASMFAALSLARKARREFARAVELDEKNFAAYQALIEFDCSAPGIAGGGEDKARVEIARVAALDAAEGHYAAGNCRRQKKDYAAADEEFDKALASHPDSPDLIYDIGDYAMKRGQAQRLLAVVKEGERVAPADPRGGLYQAVALVLAGEQHEKVEALIREYLRRAVMRNNSPRPWTAHEWLGRLYENRHEKQRAVQEYEAALKLDPKAKVAREALKRLKKG